MRRIIQIATRPASEGHWPRVYALCDDGTLWERDDDRHDTWEQFPPIPQPQLEPISLPTRCPDCNGGGYKTHHDTPERYRVPMILRCTRCNGTGKF